MKSFKRSVSYRKTDLQTYGQSDSKRSSAQKKKGSRFDQRFLSISMFSLIS